jgi:DNA-dependent RNA polymerase auxiliary subunit epsilon
MDCQQKDEYNFNFNFITIIHDNLFGIENNEKPFQLKT